MIFTDSFYEGGRASTVGMCKMTVHLNPDVVRSDSSRGKVVIVYGPNWNADPNRNSGPNCDTGLNCDSVCPLWASIPGAPERPADNLSSARAVIRKEPQLTLTEAPAVSPPLSIDTLTRRQRDVLYLIVQGKTNKEIARSLGLGEGTVKIHVAALFGKLGVHRRAAIAVAGSRFLSQGALKSA
jgi:DNA-binding CsgD family transcriptional regulator